MQPLIGRFGIAVAKRTVTLARSAVDLLEDTFDWIVITNRFMTTREMSFVQRGVQPWGANDEQFPITNRIVFR